MGMTAQGMVFVAGCVLASLAGAQERVGITLGTATPGGGFPVYGGAFVETVQEMDPLLRIEARNTKGSNENMPLLEAGQLDIGLVQGEAMQEAFSGIGRPPARLPIIAAMYSSPGMFVVRADSPYRSIRDLVGKSIVFGARGSGIPILGRYVLDAIGLDQEKDFNAIWLERAGDGPAMVLDGRAAALWGAGIGWPGFIAVGKGPAGARYLGPSAQEIARILAKHTFLKSVTIPAGSYPGQSEPVPSVGSWSFVLARPTLPDEIAYRLAKALHRGEAAIAKRLAQAAETKAANTYSAAPRPDMIHPGVMRYLKEAGIAR
jgi:TRAP transporter TAXI family solute receptor